MMNDLHRSNNGRILSPEEAAAAVPKNLGPGCERCHSLFKGTRWWLNIHVGDLRAEMAAGGRIVCPACRLLWDGAVAVVGRDISAYESFEINERGPDISMGPLSVQLHPLYPPPPAQGGPPKASAPRIELQFYTPHDDVEAQSPWTVIGKGYHIASEGLADSCVELARRWLDDCTTGKGKHIKPECLATQEAPPLPKRVIDVESNRLYQPVDGERHRYVALSHCWGGSAPVRTTRANLAVHLEALPSPLPATFRDAVAVAQALGARYLWIDSLCIIQDDSDDWRSEAAHMAAIYEKALVTISADAAACSTDGFLAASTRRTVPHIEVPYRFAGAEADGSEVEGVVCVRERGALGLLLPYHGFVGSRSRDEDDDGGDPEWADEPGAPRSVLSTRGWVFQERVLSPRTLHFSEFETAWECRSICTCECSATSHRPYVYGSLLKGLLSHHGNEKYFEKLWRVEVVQEYSRMGLTFPEDRLIALAGLALAVARLRPGDEYLAGLWRSSLAQDLLWAVQPLQASVRLAGPRQAASWSWASVTGAVAFGRSSRHTLTKRLISESLVVHGVVIGPGGGGSRFSNPLAGSELRVSGQVLRGRITGEVVLNKAQFVPDGWESRGGSGAWASAARRSAPFHIAWDVMTRASSTDDLEPFRDRQLLFLMMAKQVGGPCGLLLEEDAEAQVGSSRIACRRVGYVYSEGDNAPLPRRRGSYPDESEEDREDRAIMGSLWDMWARISSRTDLSIV